MNATDEKTQLLNEFSQRIQRHFPTDVWHSLFQDRTGSAQVGSTTRTVLCIECPESGAMSGSGVLAALQRLAPLHGGCVDPCEEDYAFVSFSRPEPAVQLALSLQRTAARARLRMGLITGRCKMARGEAAGRDFLLLLGTQRARAEALARRAAPGTVQMSPDTYDALGGQITDDLGSCVFMAEFDGDVLAEITLTLPPDASADISTFAGLGMS